MADKNDTRCVHSDACGHLDVYSAKFDPIAALEAPKGKVKLPCRVFPLDNLYLARRLLPKSHPDFMDKRIIGHRSEEDVERARLAAKLRAEKRKERQKHAFVDPLETLVRSFQDGPLSMLRKFVEGRKRVTVVTRRIDGIRGTCVGYLKAFDKQMNLLMYDVVEEFKTWTYAQISSDGYKSNTEKRLNKFFEIYNPTKKDNAPTVAAKYVGKESELWEFLHRKYGLTERVENHLKEIDRNNTKEEAKQLLSRYHGHEPFLMRKLGIATEMEMNYLKLIEQTPIDYQNECEYTIQAEWIRTASTKHPGRFFYHNTKTKQSVWEPPANVKFKTVRYLTEHKRHLRQVLLRGDGVITCTSCE